MGLRKQKNMYKKKSLILENFVLKKGLKNKTENLLKKTFKNLQRIDKNKNSLDLLKRSIILSAEGLNLAKQTIKTGKRKKTIQTTIFLVSEKSRFSYSWKTVLKFLKKQTNHASYVKLSTTIKNINEKKELELTNNNIKLIDKKSGVKFRW